MNFKSLSYELGVMMFNVAIDQETFEYDLRGNFEGIVNAIGENIDKESLKDGFNSEKENYDNSSLEFEKAFEELFV